jgi:hypothetical protein
MVPKLEYRISLDFRAQAARVAGLIGLDPGHVLVAPAYLTDFRGPTICATRHLMTHAARAKAFLQFVRHASELRRNVNTRPQWTGMRFAESIVIHPLDYC